MSKEIMQLEPTLVWENVYALTQIPRPSDHEEEIQNFMVEFGQGLGLETKKDDVGNVIIKKPASPGREADKGIILQGHLDMVPQKNSSTEHDFTNDPIDAYIDGEWVTARETTLGADNGIGVALAMAVLQSEDIEHGPIECLFTANEERGMTGAFGIKPDVLDGDILMNLDSEDEGEFCIGCAGGIHVEVTFKIEKDAVPNNCSALKLSLTGLKGGHSGVDIDLERGNANKLMNRILRAGTEKNGIRLAELNGGDLSNAIPREAFAKLVVPNDQLDSFIAMTKEYEAIFKNEYSCVDPDLSFSVEKIALPDNVFDLDSQHRLIHSISACMNGVIRMSHDMEGMVETSSNLASIKTEAGAVCITFLVRSAVESGKQNVAESIKSLFSLAGAAVEINGGYPGWKPNMQSPVLEKMCKIYRNRYGKEPKITAIHAGLECGLLGSVYPNWDMISFGPTIRFPHSPDEKLHIESVAKTWDLLLAVLKVIE